MSTHALDAAWIPTDTFANRLVLMRRELGVTVKEAADRSGLHYATWSTWENGRKPADMAGVVDAIHDAFGVDRTWLMWGKGSAPRGDDGGRVSDFSDVEPSAPGVIRALQPSDPKSTPLEGLDLAA